MTPEISVVIKTYNRPELLNRALYSVRMQALSNFCPSFEVIVVDDGGTVDLSRLVTDFRSNCNIDITYIKRDKNSDDLGETEDSINDGLKIAKGKYICHLDDDDFYRQGRLFIPYLFLEHNPEIDLVYCDSIVYRGDVVRRDSSKHFNLPRLERGNYIRSCEPTYRREILDKVGKVPLNHVHKIKGAQPGDWEFWKMVAHAGFKFGHLPIVLCEVIKRSHKEYEKVDWDETEITKEMVEKKLTDQVMPDKWVYEDFYD